MLLLSKKGIRYDIYERFIYKHNDIYDDQIKWLHNNSSYIKIRKFNHHMHILKLFRSHGMFSNPNQLKYYFNILNDIRNVMICVAINITNTRMLALIESEFNLMSHFDLRLSKYNFISNN